MIRLTFAFALICCPLTQLRADDHSWSFDSKDLPGLSVHGKVSLVEETDGRSVLFDGTSLLKVKDSEKLASDKNGFTLTVWVNPYRLGAGQQMATRWGSASGAC